MVLQHTSSMCSGRWPSAAVAVAAVKGAVKWRAGRAACSRFRFARTLSCSQGFVQQGGSGSGHQRWYGYNHGTQGSSSLIMRGHGACIEHAAQCFGRANRSRVTQQCASGIHKTALTASAQQKHCCRRRGCAAAARNSHSLQSPGRRGVTRPVTSPVTGRHPTLQGCRRTAGSRRRRRRDRTAAAASGT